jgi:hypothetical protein
MKNYDKSDTIIATWVVASVLLSAAVLYFVFTYRRDANATVESFKWMRSIDIMRYQTVEESDWSIPIGGREIRNYSAFHHNERYISGYETETKCDSNGVCKTTSDAIYSSYPVYRTKYDYHIDKWMVNRVSKIEDDDHSPKDPDVSDIRDSHDPPQLGDERTGMQSSRYTIVAKTEDNKIYSLDISQDLWLSFQLEEKCVLEIDIVGVAHNIKQD